MARRQLLSLSERESLLALPDDELTLTRMAYFSEHDLPLISAHRKPVMKANAVLKKSSRPSAGNSSLNLNRRMDSTTINA